MMQAWSDYLERLRSAAAAIDGEADARKAGCIRPD